MGVIHFHTLPFEFTKQLDSVIVYMKYAMPRLLQTLDLESEFGSPSRANRKISDFSQILSNFENRLQVKFWC